MASTSSWGNCLDQLQSSISVHKPLLFRPTQPQSTPVIPSHNIFGISYQLHVPSFQPDTKVTKRLSWSLAWYPQIQLQPWLAPCSQQDSGWLRVTARFLVSCYSTSTWHCLLDLCRRHISRMGWSQIVRCILLDWDDWFVRLVDRKSNTHSRHSL